MQTGPADTFATYSDLVAFADAIEAGKTIEQALETGDNGRGAFGLVTAQEHTPMCALCPEDSKGHRSGDKVKVSIPGGETVICEWEDIRPHKANIKDGSVIELNPAACLVLGVDPEETIPQVTWDWVSVN